MELVLSSANPRAQAGASRLARLLQGFAQEQAMLRLAWRGVAPAALQAIDVDERDLASPAARAAQWATLVPFFMLMAVLYGALHAALDTTAGERERGSLEPLLMNPVSPLALVLGKWARGGGGGHADRAAQLRQLPARPVAAAQRDAGGDVPLRHRREARCSWPCCCRWPARCRRC